MKTSDAATIVDPATAANGSSAIGGAQFVRIDSNVAGTANGSFNTSTGDILDHDGTLIYDMEDTMSNRVALNFASNSGSGTGDMFLCLPYAWFAGARDSAVVSCTPVSDVRAWTRSASPATSTRPIASSSGP